MYVHVHTCICLTNQIIQKCKCNILLHDIIKNMVELLHRMKQAQIQVSFGKTNLIDEWKLHYKVLYKSKLLYELFQSWNEDSVFFVASFQSILVFPNLYCKSCSSFNIPSWKCLGLMFVYYMYFIQTINTPWEQVVDTTCKYTRLLLSMQGPGQHTYRCTLILSHFQYCHTVHCTHIHEHCT